MSDYTAINRVFSITPDLLAEAKVIVDIVSEGVSPTAARLLTNSASFNPVSDRVAVKKSEDTAGGGFAGLDPFTTTPSDTRVYARFEPRSIYQNVSKIGLEEDVNSLGGAQAIDYEAAQMAEGANDFAVKISRNIFSTGDTYVTGKDIIGLGLGIDSTGTYAGISRSTYSTWGSSEYDISASSHSASIANSDNGFNIFRRMLYGGSDSASNTITKTTYGMAKPTVIVMPTNLWAAFEALYSQVQLSGTGTWLSSAIRANYDPRVSRAKTNRFNAKTWDEALGGVQGFETLYYSGIPIIYDDYCPSGTIFFINEKAVQWKGIPSTKKGAVNYDLFKGPIRNIDGPNTGVSTSMGVTWLGFKEPFDQYGEAGQFILH
jgi:hypothetical protein